MQSKYNQHEEAEKWARIEEPLNRRALLEGDGKQIDNLQKHVSFIPESIINSALCPSSFIPNRAIFHRVNGESQPILP